MLVGLHEKTRPSLGYPSLQLLFSHSACLYIFIILFLQCNCSKHSFFFNSLYFLIKCPAHTHTHTHTADGKLHIQLPLPHILALHKAKNGRRCACNWCCRLVSNVQTACCKVFIACIVSVGHGLNDLALAVLGFVTWRQNLF